MQVTGFPGQLTAADIEFHHFHTANAPRARVNFSSSPTLEAIQVRQTIRCLLLWHANATVSDVESSWLRTSGQDLALGAQRSNMMSVPTDCDQRDERLGWMGDEDLSVAVRSAVAAPNLAGLLRSTHHRPRLCYRLR